MPIHRNIDIDRYPKQGVFLGKKVKLFFNYNTNFSVEATCVRDDLESPYITLFKLEDPMYMDKYVLSSECMYEFLI